MSSLTLAGPDTFKWVRQDTDLWDELHAGVLTSRHLLSALGFREPTAGAALGLPKGVCYSGALADVHAQLMYGKQLAATERAGLPAGAQLVWPTAAEVKDAERHNTQVRQSARW